MKRIILFICLLPIVLAAQNNDQLHLNIGTNPDDHTGDPLRTAMQKIESNITYLFKHQTPRIVFDQTERDTIKGRFDGMIVYVTNESAIYQLAGDTLNSNWTHVPNFIQDISSFIDASYVTNAISGLASTSYVTNAISGLASTNYVTNAISGLASTNYVTNAISPLLGNKSGELQMNKDIPETVTFSEAMPNAGWTLQTTAIDEFGTTQPVVIIKKTAAGFTVVTMVTATIFWMANK